MNSGLKTAVSLDEEGDGRNLNAYVNRFDGAKGISIDTCSKALGVAECWGREKADNALFGGGVVISGWDKTE